MLPLSALGQNLKECQIELQRYILSDLNYVCPEVDEAVEKAYKDPTAGRGFDGEITRKLDEDKAAKKEVLECAV